MDELKMVIGADGVCREYKEPFATVECETEEDFNALEEAVAFREKHRWIPVTERLPDPNVKVCIFTKQRGIYLVWYTENHRVDNLKGFETEYGFVKLENVTHWMPLPDAPGEDAE